jgi:ComF family protein
MLMFFKTLQKNAFGLIFPRLCIACRNTLTNDKWLCEECLRRLEINHSRRDPCPLCGQNRAARLCTCSVASPFPFDAAYSLFDFDQTIKTVVHEIKYKGHKRLAFDMASAYVHLVPPAFFEGMHAMVAVPLHFFRMMTRGYNQAEILAKGFTAASASRLERIENALVRKRATKTQTRLSRSRRKRNVQGAFVVSPAKRRLIENKNIILVDDIITTGATTGECAAALLAAGSGIIRVLSLVRD